MNSQFMMHGQKDIKLELVFLDTALDLASGFPWR